MARLFIFMVMLVAPLKWVYTVDKGKCNGCGNCIYACTEGAITMVGGDAWIDPELCNGCGTCVYYCPRGAIYREWYTGIEEEEGTEGELTLEMNPVISPSAVLRGAEPDVLVKLVDTSGRIVSTTYSDSRGIAVFDVQNLPNGSYRAVAGEEMVILSVI